MIKKQLIAIVKDAIKMAASDIHFTQGQKEDVLIQLRAGNMMLPRSHIDRLTYEKMLAYIRFNASMDLAHPMQPQSGGLVIQEGDDVLSCRVSILPTAKFQSLVLRIINIKMGKSLEEIPLFQSNVPLLKTMAEIEAGLILIGGPTSSGKTTTAYAMIDYLKHDLGKSVITIEDPIEYQQPDIVQMQVNESAGMNYEVGIKEILRHDPDIIVVGEIRDQTTAQNAIRAALTGHLVISTIHSKDNLGTIHRMMDLGTSIGDLSQALVGLVNQRLIPVDEDKLALFEICFGESLENLVEQLIEGQVFSLSYTTIDEEFLKWEATKK
ncbi:MAG: Flp pilus assembly complex ATPase component TadA [Defluviitaleaceae bacterium]|nr:Flp pilus assembly complex ATPase component TadA [Defluviitaleaceae bacterium]